MGSVSAAELVGYLASILVAVSLTMSSIVRLRVLNLVGALLFSGYGLAIAAYPIFAVNSFIVVINVVYLVRIFRNKEYLTSLVIEKDFAYLNHFLVIHRREISRIFPDFNPRELPSLTGFYILCNDITAGVFLGRVGVEGEFLIELDYVTPQYRELRVGDWVFVTQQKFFRDLGCRRFACRTKVKEHVHYLKKMGFVSDANESDRFVRDIW